MEKTPQNLENKAKSDKTPPHIAQEIKEKQKKIIQNQVVKK